MTNPSSLLQNSGAGTTENAAEESENFPLNVDLSDCVGLPAHFRIWVQKDSHQIARSMRWLGERVRRSANIRGPFLMQVDKYFLPPDESLRLLRSTDSIRLMRMKNEWQRPFCYNLGDDQVDSAYPLIRSDEEIEEPNEVQDAQPSSPANVSPVHQLSLQNSPVPSANNAIKQNSPSVSTDRTSLEPPDFPSADPNLQRVKRRALALLQKVTGDGHQESQDDVDAPRKRRKRVRRRRPARPISPFPDPRTQMSVSMESPAESTVNSSSLPKKTYLSSPPESPDVNYSQTYTQNSNPTSLVTNKSLEGYLTVIPRYDQSYQATNPEADCQSLDRSRSPSPASQTCETTPKLVSAATVALVSLPPAPAPVVRNRSASVTRAPRVVRAISNAE